MILHDAHVQARQAWHPGDPRTVMRAYRSYLLARKRQWGTARGLLHYRPMLATYLRCKREVVRQ